MMTLRTTAGAYPEDFSDRISPMIVKEVRQGLRGKAFLGAFLMLHLALVVWALGFMSEGAERSKSGADGTFWGILALGLTVIAMRGQSAVRAERDGKTLELLRLTRLNGWAIVSGKWCALMLESVLLVMGALPYFVLRYYFGTLHLVDDLKVVAGMLTVCALFTALMIMVSCFGKVVGGLARVGSVFLALFVFQGVAMMVMGLGRHSGGTSSFDTATAFALFLVLAVPYVMLFLGVACGSVASASENLATRQRLWGVALLVPAAIAAMCGTTDLAGVLLATAMPGLAMVALDCLLRPSNTSLPLYMESFGRSGWRRAAAPVFAPSHGAGIVCLLAFWAVLVGVYVVAEKASGGPVSATHEWFRAGAVMLGILNTLMVPAALALLLGRVLKSAFAVRYWLGVVVMVVPLFILGALSFGQVADTAKSLSSLFPFGALMAATRRENDGGAFAVAIVHAVFWVAVLVPYVVRDQRAVYRLVRGERVPFPRV